MPDQEFDNINDAFRHMSRVMAEIRGEAVAAQTLAIFAIDMHLVRSGDREAFINFLEQQIDQTLNRLQPVGESTPEYDEVVRETARAQCYSLLDQLRKART